MRGWRDLKLASRSQTRPSNLRVYHRYIQSPRGHQKQSSPPAGQAYTRRRCDRHRPTGKGCRAESFTHRVQSDQRARRDFSPPPDARTEAIKLPDRAQPRRNAPPARMALRTCLSVEHRPRWPCTARSISQRVACPLADERSASAEAPSKQELTSTFPTTSDGGDFPRRPGMPSYFRLRPSWLKNDRFAEILHATAHLRADLPKRSAAMGDKATPTTCIRVGLPRSLGSERPCSRSQPMPPQLALRPMASPRWMIKATARWRRRHARLCQAQTTRLFCFPGRHGRGGSSPLAQIPGHREWSWQAGTAHR